MTIWGWLVLIMMGVLLYRWYNNKAKPFPPQTSQPEQPMRPEVTVTMTMKTVYDTEYTPEYVRSCTYKIQQYLRELENPAEDWVFGYHPDKIEREADSILCADAGHEYALKVKAQMPALRRECETKYILFRVRKLSARADAATTVGTKQKYAKESLQLLGDGIQAGVADAEKLRALMPQTSHYIAHVAIDDAVEKAKRFEFKGNKKKALEYFKDAYYSATHDNIPNEQQQELLDWLTQKIDELDGAVTIEAESKKSHKKLPPPKDS